MAPGGADDGVTIDGPDDLYGLDPADFTAARNALAKRLKAEGDRERAAEVAGLRRPSAAAGALNRVARDRPELVQEALDAGAGLRAATDAALAGDPSGLRQATTAQRAAAEDLLAAALDRLGTTGATVRDRLSAIVHAAVVDEAVAEELRRGVLSDDHDRSGLGFGGPGPLLSLVPDGPAAVRPAPRPPRSGSPPARRPGRAHGDAEPERPARSTAERAAARKAAGAAPPQEAPEETRSALERRREQVEARQARLAEDRARRRRLADLRATAEHASTAAERLARQADDAEAAAADARRRATEAADAADAAHRAVAQAEAEGR